MYDENERTANLTTALQATKGPATPLCPQLEWSETWATMGHTTKNTMNKAFGSKLSHCHAKNLLIYSIPMKNVLTHGDADTLILCISPHFISSTSSPTFRVEKPKTNVVCR